VTRGSLVVLLSLAMATARPSEEEQAVRILHLVHRDLTWSAASRVSQDLTGDGVPEVVLPGSSPKTLALGIIVGPVGPLSKMMVLSWSVELLGGNACASHMTLEVEDPHLPADLWGCAATDTSSFCEDNRTLAAALLAASARGTKAVSFRAAGCPSVHAYWDARTENLGWWRELSTSSLTEGRPVVLQSPRQSPRLEDR
jgi:hypothetical protein